MWLLNRTKFCLICGTELQDRCLQCGEAIASFQHRFCPMCGTPYKKKKAV
ncbi:double zinc ribbon domain-containing protein [Laspinema olomoucense]